MLIQSILITKQGIVTCQGSSLLIQLMRTWTNMTGTLTTMELICIDNQLSMISVGFMTLSDVSSPFVTSHHSRGPSLFIHNPPLHLQTATTCGLFQYKDHLSRVLILKIRWSWDCLVFIMTIYVLLWQHYDTTVAGINLNLGQGSFYTLNLSENINHLPMAFSHAFSPMKKCLFQSNFHRSLFPKGPIDNK